VVRQGLDDEHSTCFRSLATCLTTSHTLFILSLSFLAISTLKDGDRYLDACVRTRGKFEHAHGYYVARIKLQEQPGHWSAFWLYNSSVGKVGDGGRDGTEIDIMEKPWLDDRVTQNLHWDGYGKHLQHKGTTVTVPGIMDGWHTFALWWKPDEKEKTASGCCHDRGCVPL